MAGYTEQYLDPRWQKKRLEILERDNFTCSFCNAKDKTLHVHHKGYQKNLKLWEQSNLTMITLCEDCHRMEQELSKEGILYLTNTLKLYLTSSNLFDLENSFRRAFDDCEKGENQIIVNRPSVLALLVRDLLDNQDLQEIVLKGYREKIGKECTESQNGISDTK